MEVLVASVFLATPSRASISSDLRPLLSRKAIFLSVLEFRTSSSSRNFLACAITVSRLGSGGLDSGFDDLSSWVGSVGSTLTFNCHEGTPAFFPSPELLIVSVVMCR